MKLSNTITIMDIYGKNKYINCLSANPTKWSNTLKQFIGMCQHLLVQLIKSQNGGNVTKRVWKLLFLNKNILCYAVNFLHKLNHNNREINVQLLNKKKNKPKTLKKTNELVKVRYNKYSIQVKVVMKLM